MLRSSDIKFKLQQAAQLIRLEEVSAANALLDSIPLESLDAENATEMALLRAKSHLVERRFRALRACLAELRGERRTAAQIREISILEAHGQALAGEARQAFNLISPVIRECSPFEEDYARAVHIGGICLFRRGHYKWARRMLEKTVAFYRLANDSIGLSLALNTLALLEKSVGRLNVALGYFDESASLVPADQFPRHRGRLFSNRGVCLLKIGRLGDACLSFLTARDFAIRARDVSAGVAIDNNLGHTQRMQGDYDAALESYTKGLEGARDASSPRQECLSLEFLGELLIEGGRLLEATDYLDRAHRLATQLAPHGDLMMEVLRRRGELRAALGKRSEAEADLERAIQLCRSRGEVRERILAERALVLLRDQEAAFGDDVRRVLANLKGIEDRFEFIRTIHAVLKKGHTELLHQAWFQESVTIATYYSDVLDVGFWRARLQDVIGHTREITRRKAVPGGWQEGLFAETRSRAYAKCLQAVGLAARSDSAALIMGETGSGKEAIARLVHDQSARSAAALVAINCGALPENLVESELFGHARGTFTGAHRDKEGLFEAASAGTVLLDEIGDLPIQTQVKLLRFLDSGEFRRVGETRIRQVSVRVLAATNRDMRALVDSGHFREDLFFRLNVFQIVVPPLRNRREDILPLAEFFIRQTSRSGMDLTLSPEVANVLLHYDWPGNIRELKNLCEYLAAKAWGRSVIAFEDLPGSLLESADVTPHTKFEREKCDFEKEQIIEALRRSDGKILHAAKLLRMSRNTLATRMRALGVKRESFRA